MEYDFLQQFAKRMNSVGMYAMLMKNSWQKTTWKTFDIESVEEQLNIIFSVLLYMMEQSLEEEICTIDDIAAYLDDICNHFFRKRYSFEQSNALADFIVNVVLSDEGRAMYFPCFDFEKKEYIDTYISYIENRVVYLEDQTKRTSYKLTDQGYNLILSTLEMEGNMKLSVHEMIFRMHLERSTYDRALEEIKHIFNLLQIRLQKNEEALNRIRRNALEYSVAEYQKLLEENLETIEHTQDEFEGFANDWGDLKKGTLILGGSNLFSSWILPSLIADFARRYPLIQISLVEETTANLARMLRHGQLDLMLDSSVLDATIYGYRKFQEEHLILAVPGAFPINNTLRSYQLPVEDILSKKFLEESCPPVPLTRFKSEPFIMLKPENDTGKRARMICQNNLFEPNIILEMDQQMTSYNITCSGMGISFIGDIMLSKVPLTSDVVYYKLPAGESSRDIRFYWKNGRYQTRAMEEFLKMACQ